MSEIDTILIIMAIVIPIVAILLAVKASYTVVPPNEAHVVVTRSKGRKIYCTRGDTGYSGSSYWRIPFIQQIAKIPLENMQIHVQTIPLRDQSMAKFSGDVIAWININNPLLASERISSQVNITEVNSDVSNVIKAVTRNMSMGYTIIDIMKKRKEFSEGVENAVNKELGEWGMKVIELEVIHFADVDKYTIIKDLEERQASIINAETRKTVAVQEKDATIVETSANKDAEVAKATYEKAYRQEQISTQEAIALRDQDKIIKVQEKTKEANAKTIEAEQTAIIGKTMYEKEQKILNAQALAESKFQEGNAEARITQAKGEAEANITKAKGLAEAEATEKRADALKKYNDAGMGLEVIKATVQIKTVQAGAWAEALKAAQIKVYSGADNGILNPQTGFGAGSMAEVAKEMGLDINKILESVGKNTAPILSADNTVEKLAVAAAKKPDSKAKEIV